MDGIVIDRNIIVNTYTGWSSPPIGITIQGGAHDTSTVENTTITDNFIAINGGSAINCISSNPEAPHKGKVTIAGNTIYFDAGKCAIAIAPARQWTAYPMNNFVIKVLQDF